MKKNKVIIFDFDGVIVSSCRMSFEINREIITDLEYFEIQNWGEGNVYGRKLRENIDEVKQDEYYFQEYSQRVIVLEPVEGMEEILKKINRLGYKIVIVSSSNRESIESFLKKYLLDKYFVEIMAKDIHTSKVEKFKLILKKYKIKAKETVMVTDTVGDVKEAKEVKIKSIGVIWGLHEAERLEKNGVDFVAEKPEDIVTGMKKLLALN